MPAKTPSKEEIIAAAKEAIEVGMAYAAVLREMQGQKFFTASRMEQDVSLFVAALDGLEALNPVENSSVNGGWQPIETCMRGNVLGFGGSSALPIDVYLDPRGSGCTHWQALPSPPQPSEEGKR